MRHTYTSTRCSLKISRYLGDWTKLFKYVGVAVLLVLLAVESSFCNPGFDSGSASDSLKPVLVKNLLETSVLDQVVDPDEYYVGPGDKFTVVIGGQLVNQYTLIVAPEGVLLVPEFGPIDVAGLSLSSARSRIMDALHSRYRDVDISILLAELRRVKITVSGEVMYPGVYVLSSGDRVSEAIRMAGGASDISSRRNIELFRGSQKLIVDLEKYFRADIKDANPYVREGDIIVVPSSERKINRIGIFGAVRSPGDHEFAAGDNLYDLIMLAYGLTTDVDSLYCEIVRFTPDRLMTKTMYVSLPSGDAWIDSVKNVELFPDDRIYFRSIPEFHKKAQVMILGEVVYPGAYPIIEDVTRLSEVIETAGGLTENASLSEARMDRAGYESIKEADFERQLKLSMEELNDVEKEYLRAQSIGNPGRVSVDFRKLLVDKEGRHDITLKDGDVIVIPRLSRTVRVIGKVTRPGLVVHVPGKDAKFYIEQAGGFGWRANKGKVRVIKASSGAIVKPSGKIPIEVGDAIIVPEKHDRNWWNTAKDVGIFLANIATVYIVIDQVIK